MYLVRKISRAKWDRTGGLSDGEIPADAVTADLRTTNNTLSLWRLTAPDGQPLDDAILALVAGAERVDKVDVVWIKSTSFGDARIEIVATAGLTPVSDLVDRHVDARRLDYSRLGLFAAQIVDALKANQHKRLTRKTVARLIAAAVDDGRVTLDALQEKVQGEVQRYPRQVPAG